MLRSGSTCVVAGRECAEASFVRGQVGSWTDHLVQRRRRRRLRRRRQGRSWQASSCAAAASRRTTGSGIVRVTGCRCGDIGEVSDGRGTRTRSWTTYTWQMHHSTEEERNRRSVKGRRQRRPSTNSSTCNHKASRARGSFHFYIPTSQYTSIGANTTPITTY